MSEENNLSEFPPKETQPPAGQIPKITVSMLRMALSTLDPDIAIPADGFSLTLDFNNQDERRTAQVKQCMEALTTMFQAGSVQVKQQPTLYIPNSRPSRN